MRPNSRKYQQHMACSVIRIRNRSTILHGRMGMASRASSLRGIRMEAIMDHLGGKGSSSRTSIGKMLDSRKELIKTLEVKVDLLVNLHPLTPDQANTKRHIETIKETSTNFIQHIDLVNHISKIFSVNQIVQITVTGVLEPNNNKGNHPSENNNVNMGNKRRVNTTHLMIT